MSDPNLVRFRAAVAGALAHLEARREEVNDLNVFPVADGDTGDNMALTLRAVLDELDRLQDTDGQHTIDEIGREEIVQSVARAALLGARGNSGVILSQLIRGAAEELVSRPGQLIDATLIGAALANAAERAYSSVREPVEGTILTVARAMARQIVADVAHSAEDTRLGPATDRSTQDAAIAAVLERAVLAGQDSVKNSPELLAALRDAGVVDAGGYGLTIIFAGVVAALRGDDPPQLDHHAPARVTHPEHSSRTYRFCTNFAVTGTDLDPASFARSLDELGDSVLVVGDACTLKVHLHTDEPERATALFADAGEVSRLDVADMHIQSDERDRHLAARLAADGADQAGAYAVPPGLRQNATPAGTQTAAPQPALEHLLSGPHGAAGDGASAVGVDGVVDIQPRAPASATVAGDRARSRCGAVAVVSGDGIAKIFAELGVLTLDGGLTFNPSTYDLLAGIHQVPAEEVVLLANSANVIMAAERAAELSDKQVLVVPTTSQQAGLAAAVALAPDRAVEQNARAIADALARMRTGAVAPAARDDPHGRFTRGQAVGFIDDEVLAWGEPREALRAMLSALCEATPTSPAPELLSVLAGLDAPLSLDDVQAMADGRVELELRYGGQPAYWWLLAAE